MLFFENIFVILWAQKSDFAKPKKTRTINSRTRQRRALPFGYYSIYLGGGGEDNNFKYLLISNSFSSSSINSFQAEGVPSFITGADIKRTKTKQKFNVFIFLLQMGI